MLMKSAEYWDDAMFSSGAGVITGRFAGRFFEGVAPCLAVNHWNVLQTRAMAGPRT
jgi:hypothetical protein